MLRLQWWHEYDQVKGSARLLMSPRGGAFSGTWNYNDDPESTPNGKWQGKITPLR